MPQIRTEREGRVLTVWLDNPPHNFMTMEMVGELDNLVTSLEGDRNVGAVIVTGAHDEAFITHFDVSEILAGSEGFSTAFSSTAANVSERALGALSRVPGVTGGLERTPAAGVVAVRRFHELHLRMNRMDKVFIAAINGNAVGGGCELALACDIRLMAKGNFRIGQPEMVLGFPPGGGGTQRLSRILGPAAALESMLEATTYDPDDAAAFGIVHRVLPAESLMDEAHATAARMARRAPASIAALKRAVYEGASRSLPDGLHTERAGFIAAASQPAARRAMKAYVDYVEEYGDPPLADDDILEPWRQGIAVDLTQD
jgi:enoyl-CoA hydratase/carnithine racemase